MATDTGRDRVVVAALGSRPASGYDIKIDGVVTYESGAVVYITSTSADQTCTVTQATTRPVHVVPLHQPTEPIGFVEHRVVLHCRY